MSNKPFIEKRDMEDGFKKSRLFLNKLLASLDKWNEDAINRRAQNLLNVALTVWELPKSNYRTEVEEEVSYDLSYSDDFTNERISEFEFLESNYKVKSWKEFLLKICSILYEWEPKAFQAFADDNDFKKDTRILIGNTKISITKPEQIADNLFVETNLSAKSIISLVKTILRKFGFDEFEIKIYLKEKQEQKKGKINTEPTLFENY